MEIENIQKLVKEFPRARCLWCISLFIGERDTLCLRQTKPPCGRNFNPKKGGSGVII
jgi:hypothetical protein